ncbi:MAG: nucleotide sugar dehydrogenase [Theionarchaea archaeon]|nr:nucleotide sugar dehydrogenase [Theionarchaea archaeon]MBU7001391.1 nucleotide sugar dehydrogenase [Theionarchaea archaeon]MBU7021752.1 nucleotide sugar dehydrogenase [Theionarchaea archaeon]MBU7034506.1 nucleotide sugar dehydrogenase [Theionarchaea archaeon]MBU7040797.1 nucleotide sugar dehydrogenase [Theionarchaea archaeon]
MNVCVIGLGYVGLPFCIAFSKRHTVFGFDISEERVSQLSEGTSYVEDISDPELKEVLGKTFFPTNDPEKIEKSEFIVICVPTPIDEKKCPDLSYVESACETVRAHLRKGQIVILESTTYPGTSEEVMIPILEKSGLKAGVDFGVAFSPERIDPGNPDYKLENTPKVIGALTEKDLKRTTDLYSTVIKEIVPVRNLKTAEASKILENVFRAANIALINEISLIFESMGINVWEVIEAASSKKPSSFMPHYPGIGVGGHCIPVDPYYLSWKAKKVGHFAKFIELSGEINDYMSMHTFYMILNALKGRRKVEEAKVAVFGVAYKKNISDVRESPALRLIELLEEYRMNVVFHDPYVKEIRTRHGVMKGLSLDDAAGNADCVVFAVDHSVFKDIDLDHLKEIMRTSIIVDGKNVLDRPEGFHYYGIGKVNI